MSRVTLIVLAALMLFAGCSTRKDPPGVVRLSYTRWGDPSEMESTRELIAEFEKENPNIRVNVDVVSWEQYWQKMQTAASTGTCADVWLMSAAYVERYIEAGRLLDLMHFIRKDPTFNVDDYFPHAFDAYVYLKTKDGYRPGHFGEGPLYAFTRDYNISVLYYNRDAFDAAGIAYPDDTWTWDDLVKAARKLTIDFDGDGVIDQWGYGALQYGHFAHINGGHLMDAQARRCTYNTPEVISAVGFCQQLIHRWRVHPPVALRLEETGTFVSGRVAMTIAGIWNVRANNAAEFLWDIAPIPRDTKTRKRASMGGGVAHCIWSGTKHPQEAWKLVKYLSSERSQRELAKSGTSVPVLRKAALSEDFLAPFDRPRKQSYHYIFDSFKGKGSPTEYMKGYEVYQQIQRDQLDLVWRDVRNSPAEACKEIDAKVDKVLEKEYEQSKDQ